LPTIVAAALGFVVSFYLTLFQTGVITHVWEPFFGEGSRRVLMSSVRWLPVPDGAIGAAAYAAEMVVGILGGPDRWRVRPWTVMAFVFMSGSMAVVAVGLVAAQAFLIGDWCTLCLVSAVLSLSIVPFAADEGSASLAELRSATARPLRRCQKHSKENHEFKEQ
jgi:hypothetical protein